MPRSGEKYTQGIQTMPKKLEVIRLQIILNKTSLFKILELNIC